MYQLVVKPSFGFVCALHFYNRDSRENKDEHRPCDVKPHRQDRELAWIIFRE